MFNPHYVLCVMFNPHYILCVIMFLFNTHYILCHVKPTLYSLCHVKATLYSLCHVHPTGALENACVCVVACKHGTKPHKSWPHPRAVKQINRKHENERLGDSPNADIKRALGT